MSEPPIGFDPPQPSGPPNPPPGGWGPPPSAPPYQVPPARARGGSLWLGIAITVVSTAVIWLVTVGLSSSAVNLYAVLFAWPFLLLVVGIMLAALPKTSRTGGGMLLGLGAGVLILGGVCIAAIAGL